MVHYSKPFREIRRTYWVVHKLCWQVFGFFWPPTLRSLLNELARLIPKLGVKRASSFNRDLRVPPSVEIFYIINVDKKSIFFYYLPPSSCKHSLWWPLFWMTLNDKFRFCPTVLCRIDRQSPLSLNANYGLSEGSML